MSDRRGRARGKSTAEKPEREVDYHNLRNPFVPQPAFSDDEVANMHATALRVLEELGMKVLLPEAREIFTHAGAIVDDETQMVRLGRDIIDEALANAPKSFKVHGATPETTHTMELGSLTFMAGAGCPHASDRERGRRPGTAVDFRELMILEDSFDAIAMLGPAVEPQDVPVHIRHYEMMRTQVEVSDKVPFVFCRGQEQTEDSFQMLAIARGVTRDEFEDQVWTKTIINTNSPRQLDVPMAQGIIDFARARQLCVMTPFCLSGAMAPITVAGGLMLQHAEALLALTLAQLTRPGAPVMYGSFASNVDMKSGAPAFGTPEHVKSTLGAGQLARLLGLPWRSGGGSAGNCNDAQAAHETEMAAWSSVLAGCTMIVHSTGWLEGGLTFSYEKMVTDMEMVQQFAELCTKPEADEAALAFDAIAEVDPGGHFFATEHTMERYRTEFYEPLVADWSNFGTWSEAGSRTADERATTIWKQKLAEHQNPKRDQATMEELDAFIAKRKEAGGAEAVG